MVGVGFPHVLIKGKAYSRCRNSVTRGSITSIFTLKNVLKFKEIPQHVLLFPAFYTIVLIIVYTTPSRKLSLCPLGKPLLFHVWVNNVGKPDPICTCPGYNEILCTINTSRMLLEFQTPPFFFIKRTTSNIVCKTWYYTGVPYYDHIPHICVW